MYEVINFALGINTDIKLLFGKLYLIYIRIRPCKVSSCIFGDVRLYEQTEFASYDNNGVIFIRVCCLTLTNECLVDHILIQMSETE